MIISKQLGITPAQLGLAWLLRHSPNILLIPGTTDTHHLEENLAAGSTVLGDDLVAELNNLAGASTPS